MRSYSAIAAASAAAGHRRQLALHGCGEGARGVLGRGEIGLDGGAVGAG